MLKNPCSRSLDTRKIDVRCNTNGHKGEEAEGRMLKGPVEGGISQRGWLKSGVQGDSRGGWLKGTVKGYGRREGSRGW